MTVYFSPNNSHGILLLANTVSVKFIFEKMPCSQKPVLVHYSEAYLTRMVILMFKQMADITGYLQLQVDH